MHQTTYRRLPATLVIICLAVLGLLATMTVTHGSQTAAATDIVVVSHDQTVADENGTAEYTYYFPIVHLSPIEVVTTTVYVDDAWFIINRGETYEDARDQLRDDAQVVTNHHFTISRKMLPPLPWETDYNVSRSYYYFDLSHLPVGAELTQLELHLDWSSLPRTDVIHIYEGIWESPGQASNWHEFGQLLAIYDEMELGVTMVIPLPIEESGPRPDMLKLAITVDESEPPVQENEGVTIIVAPNEWEGIPAERVARLVIGFIP